MQPLYKVGFRKGFRVDDVQQVSRSLIEEIAGSVHEKVILCRFLASLSCQRDPQPHD